MASFNKYDCFVGDLANKVHDLLGTAGSGADTCKVLLSNTAPNASTHTTKSDASEISAGNGYTAGGNSAANVGSSSGGTFTLTGTDVVFTASGGSIGPFRYAIFYNDTSASDSLIGWWEVDQGSSITLASGESITVDFQTNILTLS